MFEVFRDGTSAIKTTQVACLEGVEMKKADSDDGGTSFIINNKEKKDRRRTKRRRKRRSAVRRERAEKNRVRGSKEAVGVVKRTWFYVHVPESEEGGTRR